MRPFPLGTQARRISHLAFTGTAILVLANCQLANLVKADREKKETDKDELYPQPTTADLPPEAMETNDVARLLAGLPPLSDPDTHRKWRGENFWRTHKTAMDKMWKEFGGKRGVKVRNWAATEVADVQSTPVVFQPFGGPDFVFSHLLFPNAETFVLCGKSPCVDMPKFGETPASVMADTMSGLREVSAAILKTERGSDPNEMPASGQSMQGALPMLLALSARTGHIVEAVELMPADHGSKHLVEPGQISLDPLTAANDVATRSHPSSACVITLRTSEGKQRRLFYFQQDLTDDGLPESAALLQYLNKQKRVVVVVNESSHELHRPDTLRLQKYIAKHAVALVQDPSGVPYRHFSPDAWNIQRYGSYAGAPTAFREFDQPELIAAFNDATSKPQPLPFGTGPVGKEMPAAFMIARPLVTMQSDLPVNVEVTPLTEPAPNDTAVVSAAISSAPHATAGSAAAVETFAPTFEASALTQDPAVSALEASLGTPLAPVDLTPRP